MGDQSRESSLHRPVAITRSRITMTERDVVCDLPYPLQCGLWFDHHRVTFRNWPIGRSIQEHPGPFRTETQLQPGGVRLLLRRQSPSSLLSRGCGEADVIDSFSYASIDEWRKRNPREDHRSNAERSIFIAGRSTSYMRNLVQQLRDSSPDRGLQTALCAKTTEAVPGRGREDDTNHSKTPPASWTRTSEKRSS